MKGGPFLKPRGGRRGRGANIVFYEIKKSEVNVIVRLKATDGPDGDEAKELGNGFSTCIIYFFF